MRIVRLMLGLALLLLLTAHCTLEQEPRKTGSSHKENAGAASIDSEKSLTEQAFDLLASVGDDLGWEFYISDGENGLAFIRSWPDEIGVWEIRSFKGTEPPYLSEMDLGPLTWFRAAALEDLPPLEPDMLIPELADPARTAISVAKSVLADEGALSKELEQEEMRALQAVADGRLEVTYDLQLAFTIVPQKLYRGNHAYDAFKSGSSFDHLGTANLLLIPEGFVVSWGPKLGGEIAFYCDGESLSAIAHAELDNAVPFKEAQRVCAGNIAKLAAIADAATLLDDRQVAALRNAADVLTTCTVEVEGTRWWMYLNELYEQLVLGEGLSPPRKWIGREPSPAISEFNMQIGDVKLDFVDYKDWDWGCILEDQNWRIMFGLRPNGLVMGYIDERSEDSKIMPVVVTYVVMDRATTADVEDAVSALSTMAQTVLASSEAKEKMNGECLDALAKVAERRLSVVSPSRVMTTLLEQVSATGDEMMYLLTVPSAHEGQLNFWATSRIATLDFVPHPLVFRRYGDIEYQVKLEGESLFLNTSEESTSSEISSQVRDAVASISRMRDSGLLHVPDFARGIVDEFVQSVSTAQEYDSVTVKPLGEIAELTVGRG